MTERESQPMPSEETYDDGFDASECWNCGGEGYVWHCIDGYCLHAEDGCELCTRRCSVCRPARKPAQERRP